MTKTKLSIVLAVHNEEGNIKGCLDSVSSLANEIIVVDGASTDKTVQLARDMGARVIKAQNEIMFHINKQKAINAANGDWILQLDADERVSPQLTAEIKKTIQKPGKYVAFYLKRKNLFLGQFLKKGGQYPDKVIRLFKNGQARLPCQSVHEQFQVDGLIGELTNDLIHLTNPTLKDYFIRFNRYTSLEAKKIRQGKIKAGLFSSMIFQPVYWFLLTFIRHKGFMDGWRGGLFSFLSSLRFPVAYLKSINLHTRCDTPGV